MLVASAVSESAQGVDLNADGTIDDVVLHVHDIASGITTNTGITLEPSASTPKFVLSERLCVAAIHEASIGPAGSDRNGDGDALDDVIAVYDAVTGVTTNLMCATWTAPGFDFVTVRDSRLLFPVAEPSQGNSDLDGDGDVGDLVLHAWSAGQAAPTNLGLEWTSGFNLGGPAIGTRHALFLIPESTGFDRNGDGDTLDNVVHVYDFVTQAVTNLGYSAYDLRGDGELFAFTTRESSEGATDLDGDGDALDLVLFAYLAPTATIVNLGLPVAFVQRPPYRVQGYVVAWASLESDLGVGVDHDGDGDTVDRVLFAYHARTGATTNTRMALEANFTSEVPLLVSGDWIACYVHESPQGHTDLNGDGDAIDRVPHLFNVRSHSTRNLGFAANLNPFAAQLSRGLFVFPYAEYSQGFVDVNGDGELSDLVAVHSLASGVTVILPRAIQDVEELSIAGRRVVFTVDERPGTPPVLTSGTDWNGDGDVLDQVLFSYDVPTGITSNHALAVTSTSGPRELDVSARAVVFAVSESGQGAASLNGDGDALDDVAHVLRL